MDIHIPSIIFHHLVKMTEDELARQIAIDKSLGPDDDWPPEFDANDIPIYMMILEDLNAVLNRTKSAFPMGVNKFTLFFLLLIPDYVRENLADLTNAQYVAMRELFEKHKEDYLGMLPAFPQRQAKDS